MEDNNIIRTEGLTKKYKNRTVVNEVSVNFHQGEIVGLLGPNGAGKTTSFYMIVGLIKPFAGKIFLNDQDITELPMYKRAQMGIAYLPQEASVFRHLTVEENIKAILQWQKQGGAARQAGESDFGIQHPESAPQQGQQPVGWRAPENGDCPLSGL